MPIPLPTSFLSSCFLLHYRNEAIRRDFSLSVFLSFVYLLCLLPADAPFLSAAPAGSPSTVENQGLHSRQGHATSLLLES